MFGLSRNQENLLAEYKALLSDLRDQIRERDRVISDLTDKVIALSSPAVLREVRRPSPDVQPSQASGTSNNSQKRRRMHWPGMPPSLQPPPPRTPPATATSPGPKAPVLSDNQILAAVKRAGEQQDGG